MKFNRLLLLNCFKLKFFLIFGFCFHYKIIDFLYISTILIIKNFFLRATKCNKICIHLWVLKKKFFLQIIDLNKTSFAGFHTRGSSMSTKLSPGLPSNGGWIIIILIRHLRYSTNFIYLHETIRLSRQTTMTKAWLRIAWLNIIIKLIKFNKIQTLVHLYTHASGKALLIIIIK